MYQSLNKRKILAICIAGSLFSHLVSLLFLQTYSLWAPSFCAPDIAIVDRAVLQAQADALLKESLQESSLKNEKRSMCEPHFEKGVAHSFKLVEFKVAEKPASPEIGMNLPLEGPPLSRFAMQGSPTFLLPSPEHFPLPESLLSITWEVMTPSSDHVKTAPQLLPKSFISRITLPSVYRAPVSEVSCSLLAPFVREPLFPPQTFTSPFQLPDFPSLKDLSTASCSEAFDVEIVFSPLESHRGYVFALTLIPQTGLNLPKIRQHYSFLIDRSNSIQKERLSAVKSAILKALEELDIEDSFNIIAFDSKLDKLSSAPIPVTSSSLIAARRFLDGVQLGSFFSTANLCKPLLLTVPPFQDEELHTAILFSDGESLSKKVAQRELALDWTAYNRGRVSLFAIGVGGDPHLATLDAVAALNRGKILYPLTKRGIKRKLLKLMKTIRHPIAHHLSATVINSSPQSEVILHPKQNQMPSLYLNEPYVILGTTKTLDNFILFVQGKLKNQWLNIRKNISFINAKKGEAFLKGEWALQQAYEHYEKYLCDLNSSHLAEARLLLEPHDLPVAFQ